MLDNLTKKLVEADIAKNEKTIMIEGAIIPSKMSQIERYSMITESVEFDDIAAVLNNIKFDEMDTFKGRMEHLYEACSNPDVISESIAIEKAEKVKRLSMTKEDYDKIVNIVKDYVTTKDDAVKSANLKKIKSFVSTINSNIAKADVVDTFIASAIRKIYNALCDDHPKAGTDKAVIIVNLSAIKSALK